MGLPGLRHSRLHAPTRQGRIDEVSVRVRGGFDPDVVYGRAGIPIRIAFHREETAACSEQVVFPALGRSATLPYGKTTVVELPASPPGVYEFTCAMDILRGRLVID